MSLETEKKLAPKLRFKEFNDEWETKKLGDISKLERGRFSPRPRNDPKFYGGNIPFVQTSDVVKSNGKIINYTQTLNDDGLKVSKLFPKGTILITIAANIGYTGILKIDMACPDSLIGIACDCRIYNVFLNYSLLREREHMDRIASEAAQKNINIEFLKPYKINIPNFSEQEKIAGFLTVLDEKISKLKEKKGQFQKYKKAVMQAIFSQKIRFKKSDGTSYSDWEEKRISEVATFVNGYTFLSNTYSNEGKFSVITIANVQEGQMNLDITNKVEGIPQSLQIEQRLSLGDILITMTGNVGRVCKVIFNNCLLNQRVGKILPINKKISSEFLFQLINSEKFIRKMISHSQGGAQDNLSKKDIMSYLFKAPTPEEQAKIADFLSNLDNKIYLINKELEQAKEFKKGLLQQMFV